MNHLKLFFKTINPTFRRCDPEN